VLPPLADELRQDFHGWERLRAEPYPGLDPWAARNQAHLESLSAAAADALDGHGLVQGDLRADNLLIDGEGKAVLVDWPLAARGVPWFDTLSVLIDARVSDPSCSTETVLREQGVSPAPTRSRLTLCSRAWPDSSSTVHDGPRRPGCPPCVLSSGRKGMRVWPGSENGWSLTGRITVTLLPPVCSPWKRQESSTGLADWRVVP